MNKLTEVLIDRLVKHYGRRGRSLLMSFIGKDGVPYTVCTGEVVLLIRNIAESIVTLMESANLTKSEMEQAVSLALIQSMFNTEIRPEEEEDDDGYD